jgi:hypothetical protein
MSVEEGSDPHSIPNRRLDGDGCERLRQSCKDHMLPVEMAYGWWRPGATTRNGINQLRSEAPCWR